MDGGRAFQNSLHEGMYELQEGTPTNFNVGYDVDAACISANAPSTAN